MDVMTSNAQFHAKLDTHKRDRLIYEQHKNISIGFSNILNYSRNKYFFNLTTIRHTLIFTHSRGFTGHIDFLECDSKIRNHNVKIKLNVII